MEDVKLKLKLSEFANSGDMFICNPKDFTFKDRKRYEKVNVFGNDVIFDFSFKNESGDIVAQCYFFDYFNYNNNNHFVVCESQTFGDFYVFTCRSDTKYPPVWDREFSLGPDYFDYIKIGKLLKLNCRTDIVIDESKAGKSVNFTKESMDEVEELIKAGRPYSIISLKAEAYLKD